MNTTDVTRTKMAPRDSMSFAAGVFGWKAKLRMLGIEEEKLKSCKSLDELKCIGKKHYRDIVKYYHPDTFLNFRSEKRGKLPYTVTYKRLTDSYKWLMELTEVEFMSEKLNRETVPDIEISPAGYELRDEKITINGEQIFVGWGYQIIIPQR